MPNNYLLIESRDPFTEPTSVDQQLDLATKLAEQGNEVTLFLVQNGVMPARPSIHSARLTSLTKAGVEVLADEFSLRERGIATDRLANGITASPLDTVIDHMASGHKVIWH